MTEKNVVFIFSGDNDDLESSVNEARDSIDGLKTSTKQASDGMKDGFGKAKKSADNLKKGTADAAKSTAEMKTKVSEAQEALGAMGAAISVVNPELGMMVQQSSALVGGVKGLITAGNLLAGSLGASFAVVAAAAAAIAVAVVIAGKAIQASWTEATQASRTLKASIERAQQAIDPARVLAAAKAWESMADVLEDLELAYRLAEGSIDQYDIAAMKAVETIRQQGQAEVFLLGIKAQKLKIEQMELENLRALGGLNVKEELHASKRIAQLREEFDLAVMVKTGAEEEIQLMAIEANARINQIRGIKEANDARKEAIETRNEEDTVASEATEKEKRRLSDLGAAMAAISAMEHDATQSTLEGIDLIESKRDDALDALRDRYIEARALTIEDYDGRLEATVAYREAKKAIEDEFDELRTEKEQELSGQRAELQAREIQNSITAAQITADAIGSIADDMFSRRKSNLDSLREYRAKHGQDMSKAEKKRLNKEIKEEKKAMRKIAVAQKAAALIDVAIKTIQGIMSAWATFGAFPPVAAALSAVIGAAGIASGVAIASQAVEFHRGGVVDAKLLDGESVLNRQATQALGNEGVDALNRAGSTSPAAMASSVTLIIGRREAREIVRTDVRSGGLITQEIGRIANTYGNVGLSGLPVLA